VNTAYALFSKDAESFHRHLGVPFKCMQ